ncbi:phospholipase D-like domain-containing protein [Aureimonas populi]|uniref:Phospholipase D n=1 Tax=Aureimonas populi TaxID=1701758 RepID=A0ABW5CL68_9HYPH|nr:phospholipase D-like domain-containing protein [Aureimonas populi]
MTKRGAGREVRGPVARFFRHRGTLAALAALAGVLATVAAFNLVPEQRFMETRVAHEFGTSDPQFARAMEGVLGARIDEGNSIQTLVNGDEIFPSMLAEIEGAERTINFETYIYWQGRIAERFAQALSQKAREGVEVNVILDAVGAAPMDRSLIARMEGAGVRVALFRPLRWYTLDRWNHRTHRKLLVVDGTVGFTGGVGIADEWTGDARSPEEWRDNHYRIEGQAVSGLQSAFAENWLEATGEVLRGENHFPAIQPAGALLTQPMKSSARSGSENVHLAVMMALASAERHVRIAMAYFVPGDIAMEQLLDLRRRGVEVDVIVPGEHHDVEFVRRASRHLWGPLLEAGVRIHEYEPTMYHPKVMVVDESFASIGSVNFDERSFRLNDEMNVNVYDEGFARTQIDLFEADLAASREVTLAQWRERPVARKALDWFWSLFRSQL